MQVSLYEVLDDEAAEALWGLYEQSFDALRTTAVQRHLMDRDEFDAVITDKRVVKHVVTDDTHGQPCGLVAMTQELAAVPLVSRDYFAARWPRQYDEQRIWYVLFMAVAPAFQGTGAVAHLVGSAIAGPGRLGGVLALDICEFNEQTLRLPVALAKMIRTYTPDVHMTRLDAQTYWAYEFPTPA